MSSVSSDYTTFLLSNCVKMFQEIKNEKPQNDEVLILTFSDLTAIGLIASAALSFGHRMKATCRSIVNSEDVDDKTFFLRFCNICCLTPLSIVYGTYNILNRSNLSDFFKMYMGDSAFSNYCEKKLGDSFKCLSDKELCFNGQFPLSPCYTKISDSCTSSVKWLAEDIKGLATSDQINNLACCVLALFHAFNPVVFSDCVQGYAEEEEKDSEELVELERLPSNDDVDSDDASFDLENEPVDLEEQPLEVPLEARGDSMRMKAIKMAAISCKVMEWLYTLGNFAIVGMNISEIVFVDAEKTVLMENLENLPGCESLWQLDALPALCNKYNITNLA